MVTIKFGASIYVTKSPLSNITSDDLDLQVVTPDDANDKQFTWKITD